MNTDKALKRIIELEAQIICSRSQVEIATMNCFEIQKVKASNDITKFKKEAKEIYNKVSGGCDEVYQGFRRCGEIVDMLGNFWLCKNCQEIRKIHFAIVSGGDDGE